MDTNKMKPCISATGTSFGILVSKLFDKQHAPNPNFEIAKKSGSWQFGMATINTHRNS